MKHFLKVLFWDLVTIMGAVVFAGVLIGLLLLIVFPFSKAKKVACDFTGIGQAVIVSEDGDISYACGYYETVTLTLNPKLK